MRNLGYNSETEVTSPMLKRAFTLMFLFVVTLTVSAQWAANQEDQGVPAYNAAPPPKGKKLPPILPKESLWAENAQFPYQTHAYELAAKIPERDSPGTVLLLLRPRHGSQQPAQLLRKHPRSPVRRMPEGAVLLLLADQEGQDPGADSRRASKGEWKQVDLQTAAT